MAEKLRIGMISSAHVHAHSYVVVLRDNPIFEFIGVWDDDVERGLEFSKNYGVRFFKDLNELLEEVEAVVIVSENVKHLEHVEMTAGKVKAILCEKPIAVNVETAEKMLKICAERKTKIGTAFPVRYSPVVQSMRQVLESGRIGNVLMIISTNRGKVPPGWFTDPELAGGGAMMDHIVHVVDLLRWIFKREFERIRAFVGDNINEELEVEDNAMLYLELGDIPVTLDCSWSKPKSYPYWGDVTFRFIGSEGVMEVDVFRQTMTRYDNMERKIEWLYYGSNIDEALLVDFAKRVLRDEELFITGEDGLEATRVVEKAYESARLGKVVNLR